LLHANLIMKRWLGKFLKIKLKYKNKNSHILLKKRLNLFVSEDRIHSWELKIMLHLKYSQMIMLIIAVIYGH